MEELNTTDLAAISVFPHGDKYVFALVNDDGQIATHRITEQKLKQVAHIIKLALDRHPFSSFPQ